MRRGKEVLRKKEKRGEERRGEERRRVKDKEEVELQQERGARTEKEGMRGKQTEMVKK